MDSKDVRTMLDEHHTTIADGMNLKSQNLPRAVKGSHMRTCKTTQLNLLGFVPLIAVDFDTISRVFLPFCGDLWGRGAKVEDLQCEKDASTIHSRGIMIRSEVMFLNLDGHDNNNNNNNNSRNF